MKEKEDLTDRTKRAAFVKDFEVHVAMWADENLFGHGLNNEAYESESITLADELHDVTWRVLEERPVR
jgi:hypothetical protein